MSQHHLHTNRLINQKSPYLLQHAHNPVDWYPWGEEAFSAARLSDKPIFLSIGYATCHWCHVMERECFENEEVAALLNETFINIKVDREELPELDSLYMEFAQSMMSGSAGWPLNVLLTPDLSPFFSATYLPPFSSHGLVGLTELIMRIHEVWAGEERENIIMQSENIVEVFAEGITVRGSDIPEKEELSNAAELLFKMADPVYGGIKGTPKFPIGYQYNFLLRYSILSKESRGLFLVERTLDMMERGGIYDHLGGGFSRYSVDNKWLVPHFEKMLYDNALLAYSYLEMWLSSKISLYRTTCEDIFQYILRDMVHPEGGFYSAEDADSDGQEGLFYTWTKEELAKLLNPEDLKLFCDFYGVTEEGNFEGRNILHTSLRIEEFANNEGLDAQEVAQRLSANRQTLWKVREQRPHPFKDDKILSSWNGLMIFSLAEAGCALHEKKYMVAALRAANFIKAHLWREGSLLRRWRDGEASFNAGLDEYAFLIRGILSLFEAGHGVEWLDWAIQMTTLLEKKFKAEEGAFYQTDGSDKSIILRKCHFSDGAEPSGNAIHCENLLRLHQLTLESHYLRQAEDVFKATKEHLENYPVGYCYHLMNLTRYYDRHAPTLVIALNQKNQYYEELHQAIFQNFDPHKAVIWYQCGNEKIVNALPFLSDKSPVNGKTTLYVCFKGECRQPVSDLKSMLEAIRKL